MPLFRVAVSIGLLVAGSIAYCAESVTAYVLSAPAYSKVNGAYTKKMHPVASFTTEISLEPNLHDVDILSKIRGINLDDGLFSGTTGSLSVVPGTPFIVSTDQEGKMTRARFKLVSINDAAGKAGLVNIWDFRVANGIHTVSSVNLADCATEDLSACNRVEKSSSATAHGSGIVRQIQYPKFTALYVFGDSNSDNGRRKSLIGFPQSPYWQGRHSDGPVAVEYLASTLGIPLNKRTDFAVGGAMTGMHNVNPDPELVNTGVLGQLETFKKQLTSELADSDALYFIKVGVNDFVGCGYPDGTNCTTEQISEMVRNVISLIGQLYALGARNIFLSGEVNGNGDVIRPFNVDIKAGLQSFAAQNSGNMLFYDYADFFERQTSKGNASGFSKLAPEYCYHGNYLGVGTVCELPGACAFWDQYFHVTTRAMHGWANDMAMRLKK